MKLKLVGNCILFVLLAIMGFSDSAFGQDANLDLIAKLARPNGNPPSSLPQIVVRLDEGVDAKIVAGLFDLQVVRTLPGANFHVLEPQQKRKPTDVGIRETIRRLQQNPAVLLAAQNRRVDKRFRFVPNDTFFGQNRLGGQWHLINQLSSIDVNVASAWSQDFTGLGVVIGIVDDGLPVTHPDLSPNVRLDLSYDFGQNDADPSPVTSSDNHGSSVAGVAAARGGNTIGVSGAAPLAGLAGLRIDFAASTDADFAAATLFESSSIPIKNHSYGFSLPFIDDPIHAAAVEATPETIHCFAAGNARGSSAQDSGKEQLHNLPNAINVAAISSDGEYASYSSFGANVIVTAPSDGVLGVTTTDRVGSAGYNDGSTSSDYRNSDGPNAADYTSTFGGTSSAAPLAAGVLALAREANPAMDHRMANHLLVLTGNKVDPSDNSATSDGGWRANGAGHEFNQNYGFGMIDATALVDAARQYSGVTDLNTESTGVINVGRFISEITPVVVNFNLTGGDPLEDLFVTFNVSHTFRGDLSAFLTSPSGFRSRVFIQAGGDFGANLQWKFRTVAFWGEDPAGQWKLELFDNFAQDSGTFHNFQVHANMGQLVPSFVLGDANGDGFFDFGDIEPFVLAITDPELFAITYPNVDPNRVLDFDGDGYLSFGDIEGFVNGLLG
ncbi:MAG: S8 family serine peptidase [Planctomycetaceae bacterium]|nr:S8 family serine peptidase [Planctomycetaceae bacterium]